MTIVKLPNGDLVVPFSRTFELGGFRGHADGERLVRPGDPDYEKYLALFEEQHDTS